MAAIGDFGDAASAGEGMVAALVQSFGPDIVITTGDNNYPLGEGATLDRNVGQFYHTFVGSYRGAFGGGASKNRFFPVLGNHDWGNTTGRGASCAPYIDWFDLPGNERYYDFVQGCVHFFALDSDPNEPDGVDSDSKQARWLRERLAASRETWNVVYFHHSPFTSGKKHGPSKWMRWPFADWGADLVLSGHEHSYERLSIRSPSGGRTIPYVVIGASGGHLSQFVSDRKVVANSEVRISKWGFLTLAATDDQLVLEFCGVDDGLRHPLDSITLSAD